MKWTKEQQQAIDERGRNILVAAAAGSGKTAVLVERIKKLMIEDGVSIDRMLIVTFTNAAAAEMKEKIRKAIYQEIEEHPENGPKMREQLALLSRANISTFHAFALDVIRKFFFEADVEPGFSICDDAQRTILREEAMDLLLERWFAKDDPAFYDFLGWYGSDKNQDKVRELLTNLYNTLMAMPHPWQWLEENIKVLSQNPETFRKGKAMSYIWTLMKEVAAQSMALSQKAVDLLKEEGLDRMAERVETEELPQYRKVFEAARDEDWDLLEAVLLAYKGIKLVARKEEKATFEMIKGTVASCRSNASAKLGEIRKTFFTTPLDEQIQEMNLTAPKAEILQELLLDFDHIFRLAKEEKRLVDFNDIEHFCLEILESGEAADYYRNKFQHIFIDEYQDTNILQEEIIRLIKRENNLFMVGDIKQSIYKFRLAEPEIFREKYTTYQEDPNSLKIDLNKNFRSKSNILKEINDIFEDVMEDYDEDARLYPGVSYDGAHNYIPQLKVIDAGSVDVEDEELASLKNAELEALEVARLVKENVGRMFFDHKQGVERPLQLKDIVLLMRGTKNYADIFYQALKDNGIDSFVDESDGYFDTIEISVFMNLLTVIDNKQQDIPLISVLHSEIFKFSSLELGQIRGEQKKGSFAGAFVAYGEKGGDQILKEKCGKALEKLQFWREAALSQPLGQFIWSLMLETGYYLEMGAMPNGSQRQANLRALVDKAEGYMEDRQVSLHSFVRYIDAMKSRKVPMGQVKLIGEQDDLVRIMTIHKSKGLEFPMVIVSGMGRNLTYSTGSNIAIHKDIGIGMMLADYKGHWYKKTLLQKLIARQVRMEEVQEETRILYVALTRAKDFLYMTGTVKSGETYREQLDVNTVGESSYLQMVRETSNLEIIDANVMSPAKAEEKKKKFVAENPENYKENCGEELAAEVLRRLNFTYPYESARQMKSKYSVTEINQTGKATETSSPLTLAVPRFRQGEKVLSAAEKGTICHGVMERIDLGRGEAEGLSYLQEAVGEMAAQDIFTEEEMQAVDLGWIVSFFQNPLGKRAAEAFRQGRLERERPFDLLMNLEGEEVIVQGIIDCYFEEDDGIVLLDYKTNWVDPSKPFEEEEGRLRESYKRQMEIYREALECTLKKPVKEAYLYLFSVGKVMEI